MKNQIRKLKRSPSSLQIAKLLAKQVKKYVQAYRAKMSGSGGTAADAGETKHQPKGWPKEALDTYDAIRPLGKGAFGLVWLARAKGAASDASSEEHQYVAIKHIKTSSATEKAYAEREISILSELNHPCIIKLIKAYSAPPGS